jgi:hypothetical protein
MAASDAGGSDDPGRAPGRIAVAVALLVAGGFSTSPTMTMALLAVYAVVAFGFRRLQEESR